MSFDPHSIERLRDLGRKLPQKLETPKIPTKSNSLTSPQIHPIETEEDPEKLFQELMNASPDGNVPPHLINQLKECEYQKANQGARNHSNSKENLHASTNHNHERTHHGNNPEDNILYVAFESLLLEDEE